MIPLQRELVYTAMRWFARAVSILVFPLIYFLSILLLHVILQILQAQKAVFFRIRLSPPFSLFRYGWRLFSMPFLFLLLPIVETVARTRQQQVDELAIIDFRAWHDVYINVYLWTQDQVHVANRQWKQVLSRQRRQRFIYSPFSLTELYLSANCISIACRECGGRRVLDWTVADRLLLHTPIPLFVQTLTLVSTLNYLSLVQLPARCFSCAIYVSVYNPGQPSR